MYPIFCITTDNIWQMLRIGSRGVDMHLQRHLPASQAQDSKFRGWPWLRNSTEIDPSQRTHLSLVHTNARGEFVKADALDRTESVVGMLILANLPHKLCYYKIRPIFVCNRSLSHITSPSCLTIDSQSSSDSSSRKYELPKSIITARHTAPSCPTTKR